MSLARRLYHLNFGSLVHSVNLLLILRVVPVIGLYIIMFMETFKTFITRIAILLLINIFAFMVIFHMLLSQSAIFTLNVNSWSAVYKTLTMGVSGATHTDYISEDMEYPKSLEYPIASVLVLIAFVVSIQVLFLNLATGLAIYDVTAIAQHAEAEKNGIKTEQIYHAEKVLMSIQKLLRMICACCGIEEKKVNLLGPQKRFYALPATSSWTNRFVAMKEKPERNLCKCQEIMVLLERRDSSVREL